MDENPKASRRKAAQKFIRSLDELKSVWQHEAVDQPEGQPAPFVPEVASSSPPETASSPSVESDLEAALADAVQDIEKFMADYGDDDAEALG
jgi:hypothetical protein